MTIMTPSRGLPVAVSCAALLLLFAGCANPVAGPDAGPIALLYGVGKYVDSPTPTNDPNLLDPPLDVGELQQVLEARGFSVIPEVDGNATVPRLRSDVASILPSIQEGQVIMFYFSGHGEQFPAARKYRGDWLLFRGTLPQTPAFALDISTADDQDIENALDVNSMLDEAGLSAILAPLTQAGARVVLILDACFTGGFAGSGIYSSSLPDAYNQNPFATDGGFSPPMFFQTLADSLSGKNSGTGSSRVWVISAAGSDEVSLEVDNEAPNHGIFTWYMIQALSPDPASGRLNADYNGDGIASVQECFRYSSEKISAEWNSLVGPSDDAVNDPQFLPHLSGNPLDLALAFR